MSRKYLMCKICLIQLYVCHHLLHGILSLILQTFNYQRDLEMYFFVISPYSRIRTVCVIKKSQHFTTVYQKIIRILSISYSHFILRICNNNVVWLRNSETKVLKLFLIFFENINQTALDYYLKYGQNLTPINILVF